MPVGEGHSKELIQLFVDLNSVYKTKEGVLVYNLRNTNIAITNSWELVVILQSHGCFQVFNSKPFRIRTRRCQKFGTEARQQRTTNRNLKRPTSSSNLDILDTLIWTQ